MQPILVTRRITTASRRGSLTERRTVAAATEDEAALEPCDTAALLGLWPCFSCSSSASSLSTNARLAAVVLLRSELARAHAARDGRWPEKGSEDAGAADAAAATTSCKSESDGMG